MDVTNLKYTTEWTISHSVVYLIPPKFVIYEAHEFTNGGQLLIVSYGFSNIRMDIQVRDPSLFELLETNGSFTIRELITYCLLN